MKKWGLGNNGLSPNNVNIVVDTVNGVNKNVVRLDGSGDHYTGTGVQGVFKYNGAYFFNNENTRVGSGLCTVQEFASGQFDVVMKVDGQPGLAPSIWTFHYEEHSPQVEGSIDAAKKVNPNDPNYRPGSLESSGTDFYSTVNSELDIPELGHDGSYNSGFYNIYRSEIGPDSNSMHLKLPECGGWKVSSVHNCLAYSNASNNLFADCCSSKVSRQDVLC